MRETFETPRPIELYVELGSGSVDLRAGDLTTTEVVVEGDGAEDVVVEQRDGTISVVAPPRHAGFLARPYELTVSVALPLDSALVAKLGSADLTATGRYASARVKSGSGDLQLDELTADTVLQTGSGDIVVGTASGDLRVKTGSGDVRLGRLGASAVVTTGSGDVTLDTAEQATVVKSGSGDVRVKQGQTDLSLTSASGDLEVSRLVHGAVAAKAVSGDVSIGVAPGIPVWTDISCVTGSVRSNLQGAGRPEEGQDYLEIRASTVSGDITLSQL